MPSRFLILQLTVSLLLAGTLAPACQAETADLRGYGRVTASFGPNQAEFDCESAGKADVLLGKLLADLFWNAGSRQTAKTMHMGQRDMVVHTLAPYGELVAARVGPKVFVIGADTDAALAAAVSKMPALGSAAARFTPNKPYPQYLDFYDLSAFKAYGSGLPSHWEFVKKFGMGGIAFQEPGFSMFHPAPGVVDWAQADYNVAEAAQQGGLAVPSPSVGGEAPFWFYNLHPESRVQPSPTTLAGVWGQTHVGTAGAGFESWGTPDAQRSEGDFAFLTQVMNRYKGSPAVGGWHLYAGAPGVEFGFHDRANEFWDYSAPGQQSFRDWLRETKKLTLAGVGQRYWNDPKHYPSWAAVTLPDVNGFFGSLDGHALKLADGWQWHSAAEQNADAPPADHWTPVALPPSQQQNFLPWGTAFYQTTFDPAAWLRKSAGKDAYLVCALDIRAAEGTKVWLNGGYLGAFSSKSANPGPFGLKVTGLLRPGQNTLALRVPGEGKMLGPVFLTTTQPKFYPYLGRTANARYADFKTWQTDAMTRYNARAFAAARTIDPDRSFVLSSGDIGPLGDEAARLATGYGMGVEFTGREAYYYPWWAGLGYVAGFYGTSEPSATPPGLSLTRMLSWTLFDGDSHHALFYDIEDFMKRETDTGWFTQNAGLLRLFGKAGRDKPQIVLLRSSETSRLGSTQPDTWDVGRGELQAAHFDNVYATEREVANGQIDSYPVLMDCGSEFMAPETVAAIRRYVEAGGTFIALHNTGRHTLLDPDAYPVSALTGFKVLRSNAGGTVTFGKNLSLLNALAGQAFAGGGQAVDYRGGDSARGAGLALAAAAPEATALARWPDGTIAVGVRRLGKGRVVTLGSSFWRDGHDIAGVWKSQSEGERAFFEALFTDLGVTKNADSGSADVWARKFTTKNGLQDWVIAYNNSDTAQTNLTVSYRAVSRPDAVLDLATDQPVPFTFTDNGWVRVSAVSFAGQGARVFGSRRTTLAGGLPVWWAEKTKYWKRVSGVPFPAAHASAETLDFDTWRLLPERTGTPPAGWMGAEFADSSWLSVHRGPWNTQVPALADYHGTGLYRARFTVPAGWGKRRILLSLYSFGNPIVYDKGAFFVNGRPVTEYSARRGSQTMSYDVTPLLHPGENVLAVLVSGGAALSGLSGPVWLAPERALEQTQDVTGGWQMTSADPAAPLRPAALPGRVRGQSLVRSVDIPAAWAGRQTFLRVISPNQWLACVVVNGRPLAYNSYLHSFGTRQDLNLTPYLQPGKSNRLELWPQGTIPQRYSVPSADDEMTVESVTLGCSPMKRGT